MGCPLTRERKQKKNPIFIFKSVRVRLRESVRLRECVNTEFHWEVKRGFEKASVSRTVCLRECQLAESSLGPARAVSAVHYRELVSMLERVKLQTKMRN